MSAAVDMLRAARARIERPEAWTKGAMSRGLGFVAGGSVPAGADCFCVNGALLSIEIERADVGALQRSGASLWLSLAARSFGFEMASKLNDAPGTTHADVLALYDRAIAMAEAATTVPS